MSEPESSAAGPPAAANSHPRLELREQDICDPENSTVVGNEPRR